MSEPYRHQDVVRKLAAIWTTFRFSQRSGNVKLKKEDSLNL